VIDEAVHDGYRPSCWPIGHHGEGVAEPAGVDEDLDEAGSGGLARPQVPPGADRRNAGL